MLNIIHILEEEKYFENHNSYGGIKMQQHIYSRVNYSNVKLGLLNIKFLNIYGKKANIYNLLLFLVLKYD